MPDTPPQDSSITPLGGSSRRQDRRAHFARSWTGYVPTVRLCPHCETENDQHARFCVGCAASIDDVQPIPSRDPNSGVRAMEARLRREADSARRSRPFVADAGTGFIISGVVLLLVASAFSLPFWIRVGVWIAGLGFAATGLWRMRFDGDAIRRTGFVLAASAIGLVALVLTRGTPPTNPAGLLSTAEPTEIVSVDASPVAATPVPGSMVTGSVDTLLGDAAHSGVLTGPAPERNPSLAWRFDTGNEILAQPIVADGTVFVTNRAGFLYAVDATTGQQRWRTELGDYALRTTPTWHEDRLYLVAGFETLALDARTGDTIWKTRIRYAGTASPTVAHGNLYVVSQEGWIYALALDDGREVWKAATDGISFAAPSATENRLVLATDAGLVIGFAPDSGRQAWRRDFESAVYSPPVIAGETVWIVTDDGRLLGLDLDDGGDRFALEATADLPVTTHDATVYVPSADGGLYAMDAETGEVRWFASAGGAVRSGPVQSGDQVVISGGNRIAGLDRETGEQVWYFLAGDSIEAPPAIVDGYVFFGARDGVLYAVTDRDQP